MPNNALIIARDKNNIIAVNGKAPWECPDILGFCMAISKDFDYTLNAEDLRNISKTEVLALLKDNYYCLLVGGSKEVLEYLDHIDSVFLVTVNMPILYNKHTIGPAATYFTHNFKKGQYTSDVYNNPKKNKFDLEVIINYPTYKLEVWERKEPYFVKEEAEDNALYRERHCLHCKTSFLSTWSGNRICNVCKNSCDWLNSADLGDETYIPEGE